MVNEELIKRLKQQAAMYAGEGYLQAASLLNAAIAALESRPAPAVQVPEDYQLVPKRPTTDMLYPIKDAAPKWNARSIYAAILDAAPAPAASGVSKDALAAMPHDMLVALAVAQREELNASRENRICEIGAMAERLCQHIENDAMMPDSKWVLRGIKLIAEARAMLAAAPTPATVAAAADIGAMVDRFLGWRLPDDFMPDAGISFTPPSNPEWMPTGTNLLHALQAKAMFEYCLQGATPATVATEPVAQGGGVELACTNPALLGWDDARRVAKALTEEGYVMRHELEEVVRCIAKVNKEDQP